MPVGLKFQLGKKLQCYEEIGLFTPVIQIIWLIIKWIMLIINSIKGHFCSLLVRLSGPTLVCVKVCAKCPASLKKKLI